MEELKLSNEEIIRRVDLKMEGCAQEGCKACSANEQLLHELAKRLGVPNYVTINQEKARRIELIILTKKMSDDGVKKLREECVENLKSLRVRYKEITCDKCSDNNSCQFAYDAFNTDGDCLAVK